MPLGKGILENLLTEVQQHISKYNYSLCHGEIITPNAGTAKLVHGIKTGDGRIIETNCSVCMLILAWAS